MEKHTPGPWHVSEETTRGRVDILAEYWGEGNGWTEIAMDIEDLADARLIAAAPELLAACKEAFEYLMDTLQDYGTDEARPIAEMARAAIAKAEGKA